VALSTDFNPGSSPTQNLWLMGTMGCSALRMTAEEVLRATTIEAAAAIAVDDEVEAWRSGRRRTFLSSTTRGTSRSRTVWDEPGVARIQRGKLMVSGNPRRRSGMRLIECVPNVSEGRNVAIVERIVGALRLPRGSRFSIGARTPITTGPC